MFGSTKKRKPGTSNDAQLPLQVSSSKAGFCATHWWAHGAGIVGIPVGYVQERETCVSCSSSVQLTVHPLSTSHSTPARHAQRHPFLRDRPTSSKKTQNDVVRFGIVQRYSGTAYMVQSIVLLATVFTMIVSNHLKLLVIN